MPFKVAVGALFQSPKPGGPGALPARWAASPHGWQGGVDLIDPAPEITQKFIPFPQLSVGEVAMFASILIQAIEFDRLVGREFFAPAIEDPLFVIKVEFPITLANHADRT